MENIDWFNLNQEEAESILPYLLQNLHHNSHIIAAKFLLCQENLTPHWHNREQVLQKLEYQESHNATWGAKVLNRLKYYQNSKYARKVLYPSKWYKPHNFTLYGRVNNYGFDIKRRVRANSTQNPKPAPRSLRKCRSLSPGSTPEKFKLSNLHQNWPSTESWRKMDFSRQTKALSGVDVIVNYKYNSILLQMFMIVWQLPEAIVQLLMDYSLETLACEYKYKHRRLRRSSVVDFSHLDCSAIQHLSPDYVGTKPSAALNFAFGSSIDQSDDLRNLCPFKGGNFRYIRRREQQRMANLMAMGHTDNLEKRNVRHNSGEESRSSDTKVDEMETVL